MKCSDEPWMTGHKDEDYDLMMLYAHVDIKGLFKWIHCGEKNTANSLTALRLRSMTIEVILKETQRLKCDSLGMIVRAD